MGNLLTMEITSVKCIEAKVVQIEQGKINEITGMNGAGKSTIIDALFMALIGITYNKNTTIIRHGENRASIKIKMKVRNIDVEVERIIEDTEDGVIFKKLVIKKNEGKITTKEVTDLFEFRSIDLLKFLELKPTEQLEYLQQLIDPEKLQAIETKLELERNNLNFANTRKRNADDDARNAKQKENIELPDISSYQTNLKELQKIIDNHKELENTGKQLKEKIESSNEKTTSLTTSIETLHKKIESLENEIEQEKQNKEQLTKEITAVATEYKKIEIEKIKERMETINQAIGGQADRILKKAEYEKYTTSCKKSKELKEEIETINKTIDELLEEESALFEGKGIKTKIRYTKEGGISLDGKLLRDLSTGQKIREVLKVLQATIQGDKIKLFIIRNANILDSSSLQTIKECVEEYGLTILCEIVNDKENTEIEII